MQILVSWVDKKTRMKANNHKLPFINWGAYILGDSKLESRKQLAELVKNILHLLLF